MCLNCESKSELESCLYINNIYGAEKTATEKTATEKTATEKTATEKTATEKIVAKEFVHNRMSPDQHSRLEYIYDRCVTPKKYNRPNMAKLVAIANELNDIGGSYKIITYKIVRSWFKNYRNRVGRFKSIKRLKLIRKLTGNNCNRLI